jgi:uncharacterized membrane protein
MEMMILGLILFLGSHSLPIFAPATRRAWTQRLGQNAYKLVITVVALIGLVLIVKGHDNALDSITWGWTPPIFTKHIAVLLMLFACIFLVSSLVPNNHIKAKFKHPMVLSVKVWAFAHFIANGEGANVILFGCFLVWAVLDFRSARQRDRESQESGQVDSGANTLTASTAMPKLSRTVLSIVLGVVIWAALLVYLHNFLFGVYPLLIPGLIGPSPLASAAALPT